MSDNKDNNAVNIGVNRRSSAVSESRPVN